MATASCEQDAFIIKDSDAIKEMFCEVCSRLRKANVNVTAEGYCEDCLEYLCAMCILYHENYQPGHNIQSKDNMPKDFCEEKCTLHIHEIVKFYCKTCDMTACAACKKNTHARCLDIKFIPEFVKSAIEEQAQSFQTQIECLAHTLETTHNSIQSHLKDILSDIPSTVAQIEKQAKVKQLEIEKKTQALIDKINIQKIKKLKGLESKKTQLCQKVEDLKRDDETKLLLLSAKTQSMKKELITIQQKISKCTADEKCGLFLAMKNAERVVARLATEIPQTAKDTHVEILGFVANEREVNINYKGNQVEIGTLKEKSKLKRSFSYLYDICFKSLFQFEAEITDLCIMSDSRIIATDRKNSSILLLDAHDLKLVSSAVMRSTPYHITKITGNCVIVTLPKAEVLQYVTITKENQLVTDKEKKIAKHCEGIAFQYPHIFLVYSCPLGIEIHNINDEAEMHIEIKSSNTTMSGKRCMLLSPGAKTIHMTDLNCVRNIDFASKQSVTSGEGILGEITGLAADRSGTLYALVRNKFCATCTIYQLSSDLGTLHEHNINLEDRIDVTTRKALRDYEHSYVLGYCDIHDKLYIGVGHTILVYKTSLYEGM